MTIKRWSKGEWDYCLYCFFNSPTVEKSLKKIHEKYDRCKDSILAKFKREGIDLEDYMGKGISPNAITKAKVIRELKQTYKLLGEPYNEKQFNSLSIIDSNIVIGVFGSWETALEKAALKQKFANHKSIETEISKYDPEKELKKTWKKEKLKLLEKAEKRKIKDLKNQVHKFNVINEMIEEAVAKAEPIKLKVSNLKRSYKSKHRDSCTLWFEFSDLQLGTLMSYEEMGGINQHNWDIWRDKLAIWKKGIINKIDFYSETYNIDRVVIACLGDMVEGSDIFKGQTWQVDRHVVDQAINGANDTAAAFTEIIFSFPYIHFDVLEVFGNHGRIGRKDEMPYSCSMDKIYQRMLESQLKSVFELENYTYHRNEAWFYFVELYGWNHLLLHGDQGISKLWSSRPTVNSLEKGLVRYNQMLQNQVHFLHCGHFHNPVNWSFNVSQILINGSFIGTSSFSASKMVASSLPVQLMYVFTPKVGLDVTHRIYLTDQVINPIEPKKL